MKVLVSGGTGLVGRYIVEGLLDAGYEVIVGGRTRPQPDLFSKPVEFVPLSLDPDLDQIDAFTGADFFVHAAFDHVPGRYRGGEGDDPQRFTRMNLDGTIKLFETAKRAGLRRAVFISSRAVYDGLPESLPLNEDANLSPPSLYGEIKHKGEIALAGLSGPDFATASLRLTGVYGDLKPNKWDQLFETYRNNGFIEPRAGTEVHGRDVGSAVRLMLEAEVAQIAGESFNVSDIVTDTHEILSHLPDSGHPLLDPANLSKVRAMPTAKIEGLGWRGGGKTLLAETVRRLASS
jgi:nucleoside-diphosphate-sugar epimerase